MIQCLLAGCTIIMVLRSLVVSDRVVQREEEADRDLKGWTTSEVGEKGWKMQEHWQFQETPTALLGLRHAEMR